MIPRLFLLLPGLALAGAASAASAEACAPALPWCGGLGFGWIPLVIALQFVFLYVGLGGPGGVLGRYAGYIEQWSRERFAMFQIGFPIALVMSFPALLALTLIDKWFHRVGLVEVAVIQALCWFWMHRWLHRGTAAVADEIAAPLPCAAGITPELAALSAAAAAEAAAEQTPAAPALFVAPGPLCGAGADGQPALVRAASVSGPLLAPGTAFALAEPSEGICLGSATPQPLREGIAWQPSGDERKALLDRLSRIYMWDEIGLGKPFRNSRLRSPERLIDAADEELLGAERLALLRGMARRVIARHKCGSAEHNFATIFAGDLVHDFDEYAQDVMQRLTYSVLYDRQRLFIDRTDVEVFGDEQLDAMYRLALFEVQADVSAVPGAVLPAMLPTYNRAALH